MPQNHYEPLSSEKYLLAALQQQAKAVRKQRSRETFRTCLWVSLSLSIMGVGIYTMPIWVDGIIQLLESRGW